jgi:hypothetical protein
MIMSKNKPTTILALTMVSLVAFGEPSRAQTPAPVNPAQEEIFLDVLPKVEIPDDVQPLPGAVNEEFRTCRAFWPKGYDQAQSGPEARALRDIYGFVQARSVIMSQNCTCAGKVGSWDDVESVATSIRKGQNVQRLSWQQTKAIAEEANRLTEIAEMMCGGSF